MASARPRTIRATRPEPPGGRRAAASDSDLSRDRSHATSRSLETGTVFNRRVHGVGKPAPRTFPVCSNSWPANGSGAPLRIAHLPGCEGVAKPRCHERPARHRGPPAPILGMRGNARPRCHVRRGTSPPPAMGSPTRSLRAAIRIVVGLLRERAAFQVSFRAALGVLAPGRPAIAGRGRAARPSKLPDARRSRSSALGGFTRPIGRGKCEHWCRRAPAAPALGIEGSNGSRSGVRPDRSASAPAPLALRVRVSRGRASTRLRPSAHSAFSGPHHLPPGIRSGSFDAAVTTDPAVGEYQRWSEPACRGRRTGAARR